MDGTPKILAFDTASARGSVSLLEGTEVRAEIRSNSGQTHSALLLQSVEILLQRAHWQLKDLTLIAAGIGPGSFTGIRIGVATAMGLAQSLSIPYAGVSGLDVLAHQVAWLEGRIAVLMDAHRQQFYHAEYVGRKGRLRRKRPAVLLEASDIVPLLRDRHVYVVGDLSAEQWKLGRQSPAQGARIVPVDLFLASGVGRLALARKKSWRAGEFIVSEPLYIRPPDAIRNKAGKR